MLIGNVRYDSSCTTTNGYRAMWAANGEADVRTVVDTTRLRTGARPFQTITLIGHVALANDMHRLIADGHDVLTIFRGDEGYVSPNFYPSKPEYLRHVPTWNYQVVHIHGAITFQHNEHAKQAAVGLLTRTHERRLNGKSASRMANAPPDFIKQMLGNIVAFRIDVRRILAKSKLSQNREKRDYAGAISGLRASGHEKLAQTMERRQPKVNRRLAGTDDADAS